RAEHVRRQHVLHRAGRGGPGDPLQPRGADRLPRAPQRRARGGRGRVPRIPGARSPRRGGGRGGGGPAGPPAPPPLRDPRVAGPPGTLAPGAAGAVADARKKLLDGLAPKALPTLEEKAGAEGSPLRALGAGERKEALHGAVEEAVVTVRLLKARVEFLKNLAQ